jgi:hypothetical protein
MLLMLFSMSALPLVLRKIALKAAHATIREDVAAFEEVYSRVQQRDADSIQALDVLVRSQFRSVLDGSLYGGPSLQPRQDHSNIDRLYADAESVNSAFQELCLSWFDDNPSSWVPLCDSSRLTKLAFNFKAFNPQSASKPVVVSGPVKLASRSISKIVRSYKGDASLLTDLVRCVVVFPNTDDLLHFMRIVAERGYIRERPARRTLMQHLAHWNQYYNHRILGLPSKAMQHDHVPGAHAFEILRIKNRFQPEGDTASARVIGYRDVSIKVKFGYKESPSGSINFVSVQEWIGRSSSSSSNSSSIRTIVTEIQLRLHDFQSILDTDPSVHNNYVFFRDILSS